MNIALDARIANYTATGIARYANGCIRGIAQALTPSFDRTQTPSHVTVLETVRKRYALAIPPPLKRVRIATPPHFRFEHRTLPLELSRFSFDLIHCTDFFAATPHSTRALYTVHDLFFLNNPELLDRQSQKHYGRLLALLPTAHHVTCISEYGKRELLTLGLVPPEKITVIYPGIGASASDICVETLATIQKTFGLASGCVLFVGTIEPRKNLPNMVEGYLRAYQSLGETLPPFCIVGGVGHRGNEIYQRIEALRKRFAAPADAIRFLGSVNDHTLSALYRIARVLLFVTRGEGFGFPILEAMQVGVPVITSDSSASAEIAGPAGVLVSPELPEAVEETLVQLISSPEYCRELSERGQARARDFSWERTGEQLLRLYSILVA